MNKLLNEAYRLSVWKKHIFHVRFCIIVPTKLHRQGREWNARHCAYTDSKMAHTHLKIMAIQDARRTTDHIANNTLL